MSRPQAINKQQKVLNNRQNKRNSEVHAIVYEVTCNRIILHQPNTAKVISSVQCYYVNGKSKSSDKGISPIWLERVVTSDANDQKRSCLLCSNLHDRQKELWHGNQSTNIAKSSRGAIKSCNYSISASSKFIVPVHHPASI